MLEEGGFNATNLVTEIVELNTTLPVTNGTARMARVQVGVSSLLGLMAFVVFSILRVRYPDFYVANFSGLNYSPYFARQELPRLPSKSLFGWIPVVAKVNEQQILSCAGLDAAVFLNFFKMSVKIIAACLICALFIISPVRYRYTGKLDQEYPSEVENLKSDQKKKLQQQYLVAYTLFTYVFTFVVLYFLFKQTRKVISIRQKYLGKQNSITDRTIELSGIPPFLRDEEDLRRHIESLGIGEVTSVVLVREWGDVNKLFELRLKVLRKAESYWAEYFARKGVKNIHEITPGNIYPQLRENINISRLRHGYSDSDEHSNNSLEESFSSEGRPSDRTTTVQNSVRDLNLFAEANRERPKIRRGMFGIFGKEEDAISHFSEKLEVIDKEILRARGREYPGTSTAFITMKSVAQAQMVAQAVLDPKIDHLISNIAPAPHDVIWKNLYLSRKERKIRIYFVTLFIGLLSVLMVVPVTYLAQFLNISSISHLWPSLGKFLESNKLAAKIVTTLLPTYIFTLFNVVMPLVYVWVSTVQGYTSHSDEELSIVSKNFFYIFVNLFLVFTMAGTASLSDTTKIAYKLAASLKELSLFYVDLIIFQGLGIFPYKLLLMGNFMKYSFESWLWCKTPRDYLRMHKPPIFNFGLQLPQPILIFIITIVYSVMSTKILTASLVYFIIGYFVYKYQLLYGCIHPPHSTGKVWPLIFRRIILGLLIFQLTMAGVLALQKAYAYATLLAPLPIITGAFLWNFEERYIPLSIFIALRSIENSGWLCFSSEEGLDYTGSRDSYKTVEEQREINTTYAYPQLIDPLDGPIIAIEDKDLLMLDNNGSIIRKRCDANTLF